MVFEKKCAQVWVETAIYTLMGLTIIAILLSVAMPQIDKIKDRGVLRQTHEAMNVLDGKISEVRYSDPGNSRVVNLKIAKGKLEINPEEDKIVYTLENTRLEASEPDLDIEEGNMILKTERYGSRFKITLTANYEDVDIVYREVDESKILQAGATDYQIFIENKGDNDVDDRILINFDVV